MSKQEQSNKILAVALIGSLGLFCVWHGVGWVYDWVVSYA